MKQNQSRTELQQRLDAQLRAKAAERSKLDTDKPDGIDDSAYIENTKQTTSLSWAWAMIAAAILMIFLAFVFINIFS